MPSIRQLFQRRYEAAFIIAAISIVSVLFVQHVLGYEPCELCSRERIPYYVALPALVVELVGRRFEWFRLARGVFAGIAFTAFAVGLGLAVNHFGVEHGWWEGPATCIARSFDLSSLDAFAAQIGGTRMVSCNTPSFLLLGMSLATWNVLVSGFLAVLLFRKPVYAGH